MNKSPVIGHKITFGMSQLAEYHLVITGEAERKKIKNFLEDGMIQNELDVETA